jgi:NAD dependent epimerase/dehydratase family enzyme
VPSFAAKLMAGEMAEELLLSGQNVIPERLLKDGFEFQYADLAAALGELLPRRS